MRVEPRLQQCLETRNRQRKRGVFMRCERWQFIILERRELQSVSRGVLRLSEASQDFSGSKEKFPAILR